MPIGYNETAAEATVPVDTDLLGIQQGTGIANMKKITKGNLFAPTDASIASLDASLAQAQAAIAALQARGRKIYGIDYNRSTWVTTILGDRVGLTCGVNQGSYTAPQNDLDSCYPWSGIVQVKVNDAGEITSRRGDLAYDTDTGDFMGGIPIFWFYDKEVTIDGVIHRRIMISDAPAEGFRVHPLFVNPDGTVASMRYRSRVHASYVDGKLRSLPDQYAKVDTSMISFRSLCAAKGSRWHVYDKQFQHAMFILMTVEAGTFNIKTIFGYGVNAMPYGSGDNYKVTVAQTAQASVILASSTASAFKPGMMLQIGTAYTNANIASNRRITAIATYDSSNSIVSLDGDPFDSAVGNFAVCRYQPVTAEMMDAFQGGSGYWQPSGYSAGSHCNTCWRGFWDSWGNIWSWLDGIMRQDGKIYLCFDPSKYVNCDNSSSAKYPASAEGWIDISYKPVVENGWQANRKVYDDGVHMCDLPEEVGAGSTSGYCAYLYYFGASYQSGIRAVQVGGSWYDGSYCSILYEYGYYAPSGTYYSIGSFLILL